MAGVELRECAQRRLQRASEPSERRRLLPVHLARHKRDRRDHGGQSDPRMGAGMSAQVDPLAMAVALSAAGAPERRCDLELRHQPVELRELAGRELIEALGTEHLELGLQAVQTILREVDDLVVFHAGH